MADLNDGTNKMWQIIPPLFHAEFSGSEFLNKSLSEMAKEMNKPESEFAPELLKVKNMIRPAMLMFLANPCGTQFWCPEVLPDDVLHLLLELK